MPLLVQSPLYLSRVTSGSVSLTCDSLQGETKYGEHCSLEQSVKLKQQLAGQIGALLCVAHVMRIQPLLNALHKFILWATVIADEGLLHGVLSMVFADQVLQEALGSSIISKESYIKSVLTRPVNLCASDRAGPSLLEPVGDFDIDAYGSSTFRAKLLQGFVGGKAGEEVYAVLELRSLLDPDWGAGLRLSLNDNVVWLPVQLLLGTHESDSEGFEALMNKHKQQ